MQSWWLVSAVVDGEARVIGQRADDVLISVPAVTGANELVAVLDRWQEIGSRLRGFNPDAAEELAGDAPLLAPLRHPRKVLCSGPNFTDHLAEMGEEDLGDDWTPYFFLKPPTTAIVGPNDDIPIPSDPGARADWEGELGVVIGRRGRDLSGDAARDAIAGYLVADDVSLRGPHHRPDAPAPFAWDWLASKGADGSLPLGPGMTPSWCVEDPQSLRIRTVVDGQVRQDGTTADMLVDVVGLVSAASRLVTLEPGDVILSGTPAGVGAGMGVALEPGQVVEVSIAGLGTIRNRVVARDVATQGTAP